MPRVKRAVSAKKKRKTVLTRAKGYYGAKSRSYRAAKYEYRDRRTKKREIRRLWITRINAGARLSGMSYSQFMHGLNVAEIGLDRKVLADMAVNDPASFAALVEKAKTAISA
jgi:large subunit ribosomal protein L20